MKVYVLGIDHEIQLADSRPNPARSEFMKLLTKIFSEHKIEFIGEETFPDKAVIARVFGELAGIRWEAIEMSLRARQELGIQEEQAYNFAERPVEIIQTEFGEKSGRDSPSRQECNPSSHERTTSLRISVVPSAT
jgi:hypothetical protein